MANTELSPGVWVLDGAVNTGVLVSGKRAVLFDCDESVTPERLRTMGVDTVEMILCTQHRRPNVAGAPAFVAGETALAVPERERALFDAVDAYWADWRNRWHLYHFQPGPQVLARSIKVARTVCEGDTITWNGFTIRVLDTPGPTGGSVSYVVTGNGASVCFSGDCIYGAGQLWELYSLQRGFGGVTDYHGFLGARELLIPSLNKLAVSGARTLVPSHGAPMSDPAGAVRLLLERLDALWRNYAAISALNHYMPQLLNDVKDDPLRMPPAQKLDRPAWVRRVAFTSYAVVSDTGAAMLIDCGHDSVIATLEDWLREKQIASVDGCWITHYHDDHVDSLHRFATAFRTPICCIREMAEIIEHPDRFFLPCISPCPAPVAKACADGESWEWNEFRLTAFHFPGQTYYHGGLLVEGHGKKVFFAGDSGAPTGLDDYTAGNRVFTAPDRGSRQCLALWKRIRPDYILNEHQERAFAFTDEQLAYMDDILEKRERLIGAIAPWADPAFAVDEWWVRAYPYQQTIQAGATVAVDVQFTNHGSVPVEARIEPVIPDGWTWDAERSRANLSVPARTAGSTDPWHERPDATARIWIQVPAKASAGPVVVPFGVTWDGRALGPFRHAVLIVLENPPGL